MSYETISLIEMDDFLRQRRFKPVDLYFRRRPVKEWVYERRLPQNANHFVRVYTTIQRYGGKADQSRDVGKDAIRVQVIYRDEKGETLVSMPKRVNRVSTWRDNLDDRLKEVAESLPKVKMDSRGEPMTLRKKRGNLFWGSRDYPAYQETRRYGSEYVGRDKRPMSPKARRNPLKWMRTHELIDDIDWLESLEEKIVLGKILGDSTSVMFGPDWVETIDKLMLDRPNGMMMVGGNLGETLVILPSDEDQEDWILIEWQHITSGGDEGVYDTKPFYDSRYISKGKKDTTLQYEVTTFITDVWGQFNYIDSINQSSIGGQIAMAAESEDGSKGVAVLYPEDSQVSGVVRFQPVTDGLLISYKIKGLTDGKHGFHIHEYGDLTDGCTSACAHFNPDGATHGGLETKIRHFGDLGNIVSNNGLSKGYLFLKNGCLDGSKYSILGRMIIVHADPDDLGKGGDEESLKTGNAGKRLACGVIGLADPKEVVDKKAETVRECCKCQTQEGLATVQEGTYCYDCLPINLGAEDNYDATYGKKQAKIRRRLKNKIMKQNIMGTAANKWSARKSQELKRQYEKACEKAGLASYKGSKTAKQDDLSNWSKQKWTTASGKKSSVTGEPYFPEKAVAALKKRGLYAKAKRQKQKANKAKKNARYSDDIREVVGQFRAEDINQTRNNTIINLLLVEWIMRTNQIYDSLTISKGLADYIDDSPYDFVRHMQNQDLISLMPSSRALVPADFLYYLKDKDRDHWANMKSRAISKERYQMVKEQISEDVFWLSDHHKVKYYQWLPKSAINYQNI